MRFNKRGSVLSTILTIIAILAMILVMIPVVSTIIYDSKIEKSNDNAALIYNAAQLWLNDAKSNGTRLASTTGATEIAYKSENNSNLKSEISSESNFIVMDLAVFIKTKITGYWYVSVNPSDYTVVYALWCESKIPDDMLKKQSNQIEQKKQFKDSEFIVGCYPLPTGTYKN